MRRPVVLLTATTSLVLGLGLAGSAAAAPPRDTHDVNCRPGTACLFLKTGWQTPPGRRNVGG